MTEKRFPISALEDDLGADDYVLNSHPMKFLASKHQQVINVVQIGPNARVRRLPGMSEGHLIPTQLLSRIIPASDRWVPKLVLRLSRTV